MARGSTLLELTEMVRAECRRSTNASRGMDDLNNIQGIIRRQYERLYDEFDWPFLKALRKVEIEAGSRYYDLPDDMNLERVSKVSFKFGGQWHPLDYGIGLDDYSAIDSELGVRSDPVQKWQIIDVGGVPQIEVWPLPASAGEIAFDGIRSVAMLTANDSVCEIDDQLVVLYTSAEVLMASESADYKAKLDLANSRLARLKGRLAKKRVFNMAGNSDAKKGMPRIQVAYAR